MNKPSHSQLLNVSQEKQENLVYWGGDHIGAHTYVEEFVRTFAESVRCMCSELGLNVAIQQTEVCLKKKQKKTG